MRKGPETLSRISLCLKVLGRTIALRWLGCRWDSISGSQPSMVHSAEPSCQRTLRHCGQTSAVAWRCRMYQLTADWKWQWLLVLRFEIVSDKCCKMFSVEIYWKWACFTFGTSWLLRSNMKNFSCSAWIRWTCPNLEDAAERFASIHVTFQLILLELICVKNFKNLYTSVEPLSLSRAFDFHRILDTTEWDRAFGSKSILQRASFIKVTSLQRFFHLAHQMM